MDASSCPDSGTAFLTSTGRVTPDVRSSGPWALTVEQQIDVPLEEPPLPAMTAPGSREVAAGDRYRIDQSANGRITLHQLEDGSYAFRLDSFFVTPTSTWSCA